MKLVIDLFDEHKKIKIYTAMLNFIKSF